MTRRQFLETIARMVAGLFLLVFGQATEPEQPEPEGPKWDLEIRSAGGEWVKIGEGYGSVHVDANNMMWFTTDLMDDEHPS